MGSNAGRILRLSTAAILAAVLLSVSAATALGQAPEPTRAQYVATVDPMCHAGTKAMQKAQRGVGTDIKHRRYARAGGKIIKAASLMHGWLGQIAAVPRPPADSATLGVWLQRLEVFAGDIARVGRIFRSRHFAKLRSAQNRFARDGRRANQVVAGFGFHACRVQ